MCAVKQIDVKSELGLYYETQRKFQSDTSIADEELTMLRKASACKVREL